MILVPCIHFRMYIGTRAENENSDYCYFIYTVMKVLLNIYIHCSVVHSYGISCSTSSSSYSSSLSIIVLAIFRAQREISTDKSGVLTLTTVVRPTGLGALASDKPYNCLWSWWKICHD